MCYGISLISFVGIFFIGLKEAYLKRILTALVGFASGSLIGGAFIHLLPEAVEKSGQVVLYHAIMGMMFFFVMEKFLHWRHCHEESCQVHAFAYVNLFGDRVHNFIDGIIIAASFILSLILGPQRLSQWCSMKSLKRSETLAS
jgi:zinc and cadmium transporter